MQPVVRAACIDIPTPSQICDPLCFRVEGWLEFGLNEEDITSAEIWVDGRCVGRTALFFSRPDVNAQHPAHGFQLLAYWAGGASAASELELRVTSRNRPSVVAARVPVQFTSRNYRDAIFGNLLDHSTTGVWCRKNLNTSGPSLAEGSAEVANLLTRYLPAAPSHVLDVGCGLGYYGKFLRAHGYDWVGVEIKASDCAELAHQNLPHRHVDGQSLPFADQSFEAAICIEVLEHIDEPKKFLAEVKRIAPKRLLVSVPNAELVPYLADVLATPLHMLDTDHKNFFTRWSLAALLREFYDEVELLLHTRHPLNTPEGLPLYNHLFAIARSPR